MAKTFENSKGQVFNTQAEAALSNTALGTNPSVPNINTGTIPVGSLTIPVTPLKLPTPTTPTYGGLQTTIAANIENSKVIADEQRKVREEALKVKGDDITSKFNELLGVNADIANVSSSTDRTAQDEAQKKYDDFTSQLEAEQLRNTREIESLQKNNPQGLFGGALTDEVERLNRDSLSKQADIAILQAASGRDYERLSEIADRQVALKTEALQASADNLRSYIEFNKADFDKEDERLYNEAQKTLDQELLNQTNAENAIKEIKLAAVQNGAGLSVLDSLSKIDTTKPEAFDEALKIGGSYLSTSQNDIIDVNGNKMLVDKRTGAVIKNYGGGTSPGIVQRTVNGSPVEGYTLISGDDPYFIAQTYGIDMNALKSLNPTIADWTNIPAGATINVPSKNAAQTSALQTILGSNKFTKDQVALVTNAISNGQDPFTVIKNQARDIMGTEGTATLKLESAKTAMQELDSDLKKYYEKGGTSGLFQGSVEKFENRLGTVKNPELVALATKINTAMQKYRNAVSGTAYSVQEGKDIASVFPGITKGELLNNTIIGARLSSFDSDIDGNYRNVLGSAYDALKVNSTTPVDPKVNVETYGDAHPEARQTIIQMQKDGIPIEAISNWVNQFK